MMSIIQLVLLVLLTLQNSGQLMLIKYAQRAGSHPDPLVVMFFAEVVKAVVSFLLFIFLEAESVLHCFHVMYFRKGLKVVPIALVFALQNQLQFEAIHHLEPPVFQALSQLKLISAGIFSFLLLGKQLNHVQWVALVLLACGAALVQMESSVCEDPLKQKHHGNQLRGIVAITFACGISGLGGCYTELMLKTEKIPMWMQSFMVASISGAILSILVANSVVSRSSSHRDLLEGFVPLTWLVVAVISLGGLLVVAILRLADNVLKGISMVFSLLMSGILSKFLFGSRVGGIFAFAAIIVCCGIYLYQFSVPAPPAQTPTKPGNSVLPALPAHVKESQKEEKSAV